MKKLYSLIITSFIFAAPAFADTCSVSLMPPFTPAQAEKICGTFGAGYIGTQANNTYVNARNAANSGNISVWKVDATDDTVLNADTGDVIKLSVAGTSEVTVDDDKVLFAVTASGTPLIGTTSTDATDSNSLAISSASALATDGSRGGTINLKGNEAASNGGAVFIYAGDTATGNIQLKIENASSGVVISDITTGTLWTFNDNGALTQDSTNGASIIMAKAATGLIAGEATRASAVTTATQLAVPLYISAAGSGTDLAAFISSGASATGANVDFFKTRASSGAASTIVSSGDTIGKLSFYGANGTTYDPAATIVASVSTTPGAATDMPGKLVFNLTPDSSATPAAVLTLDQDKSAVFTGTVTSSRTTDLGWAVVDSTDNTACNSICTSAAVFGFNLAAGASSPVLVGPSDATADICLCAGAS